MLVSLAMYAAGSAMSPEVPQVDLADRSIRAGDLAHIPGQEDLIVANVPVGRSKVEIGPEEARRLLRNRVPNADFSLRYPGTVRLVSQRARSSVERKCYVARRYLVAGDILSLDSVSETGCDGDRPSPSLGYDRVRGEPFANGSIEAGSFLGAVRPAQGRVVEQGQPLTFRTVDGPVVVERSVETLQPGRPGRPVFAKTEDGEVISATLADNLEANSR